MIYYIKKFKVYTKSIYQKYIPSNDKLIENDTEGYNKISETIESYGFRDLEVKLYHQIRVFNSSDYISLLNTYSDHRSMGESGLDPLLWTISPNNYEYLSISNLIF